MTIQQAFASFVSKIENNFQYLTSGKADVNHTHNQYYTKSETYTKAEVENLIGQIESGETTLAMVATSGDYNDLINKPDLTTKVNVSDIASSVSSSSTNSVPVGAKLFYDTIGDIETLLQEI